jgi:hypothetical protein
MLIALLGDTVLGEKMPRRKKQERGTDVVFLLALIVLVFWILKMILKFDPPYDDLLSNIPWISVAFGAGALFMKVTLISKDLDDIQKDSKEVRDAVNQIKGKLGIP